MSTPNLGQRLLDVIVILLTPLFLDAADNNIPLAHAAARHTIEEYRARSGVDLLLVAQIVAFSLASIAVLMQSFQEDLSLEVKLRLQGKANTLNRTADRARKALDQTRQEPPPLSAQEERDEAEIVAKIAELSATSGRGAAPAPAPAAQPIPAPAAHALQPIETPAALLPPRTEEQNRAMWLNAFVEAAEEITTSLPNLPPDQRRSATIYATSLNNVARELRNGPLPQPSTPAISPPGAGERRVAAGLE